MKKITFTILISLMLTLPACAGRSQTTEDVISIPTVPQVAGQVEQAPATTNPNVIPLELQLLLGTLKLNETDLAVSAEQAEVLLPLWSDFKTISMSMAPPPGGPGQNQNQAQSIDTETQAEIDALVAQIQAVMTPEQIEAINEMNITPEMVMSIMQEQGLTMGGPGGQASQGSPPGPPPGDGQSPTGGQVPQGTPPSDLSPGDAQTFTGSQPPSDMPGPPPDGQGSAGGMVPPPVIDALLQSLSQISGAAA